MVNYENFIVPEWYYNVLLKQHRIDFIKEYYKSNQKYPTSSEIENVVLSNEEKERLKHRLYIEYCITETTPSIDITPNTPQTPSIQPEGDTTIYNRLAELETVLRSEIERSTDVDNEMSGNISRLTQKVNSLDTLNGGDLAQLVNTVTSFGTQLTALQNENYELKNRLAAVEQWITSNEEGGDGNDSPSTPPIEGNMVNVSFSLDVNHIPQSVGDNDDFVNTIFKNGMINGELIDLTTANITFKNDETTIKINDMTKTYSLPIGEYNVTGSIGSVTSSVASEKTFVNVETSISITHNGEYIIPSTFEKNIVVSNKEFILQHHYVNGYNSYDDEYNVFYYDGYYYCFSHTPYRLTKRVFIFDNITYEVLKEDWEEGTYYYYHI